MIQREFYLSSHDFCSDPRPRKCKVVQEIKGLRANSNYLLVKITPPVTTKFWDGPSMDFDQIVLAIRGKCTTQDIGTKPVVADIVICPTCTEGTLDEKMCSRIGVGGLHATHADALKDSPVEER